MGQPEYLVVLQHVALAPCEQGLAGRLLSRAVPAQLGHRSQQTGAVPAEALHHVHPVQLHATEQPGGACWAAALRWQQDGVLGRGAWSGGIPGSA